MDITNLWEKLEPKQENIDGIKKQIETKYPEYVFDTSDEEVNLERIMGINHFENRVLLYQL